MKLGMCIIAPTPIWTAYFMNPFHQSVSVIIPLLSFAKQRLGKHFPAATNVRNYRRIVGHIYLWVCLCIPLSLLGNISVKKSPWQRRIVGGVDFYAVLVISMEIKGLVLPTTSCLSRGHFGNWTASPSSGKNFSWAQSTDLVPISGHQNPRKTGYKPNTTKTSSGC
jgi:hypothetical protein